jgi:glycosyltransferase involved in cell wall biosynthesis
MSQTPQLSLIVPAYNEAKKIDHTLSALRDWLTGRMEYEIIVCADGTDATAELVAEQQNADGRIQLVASRERGGKGRAIRQGMARAQGDIIGFLDADYKVPIEEYEKLLFWLDEGFDIVIGSRGLAESVIDVPQRFYRQLGSRLFGLAMHSLVGLRDIRDTQCGFKFFRNQVARDLFARQRIDGYMFDVEVLYLARLSGYRIKEVGVRWRDDDDSRLQLISGNWRNMIDLFRIRFNSARVEDAPLGCLEEAA